MLDQGAVLGQEGADNMQSFRVVLLAILLCDSVLAFLLLQNESHFGGYTEVAH